MATDGEAAERLLRDVAARARTWIDGARDRPVSGACDAGTVRRAVEARLGLETPQGDAAALDGLAGLLERFRVDVTHPRYFGLFNPSVLPAAAAGAALVAAMNPQTAVWAHNPAAAEIERHVLRFLAARIGWEGPAADAVGAHFTSSGQESNLEAVVVALTHAFPEVRERGVRAVAGEPVAYVSEEGHHSIAKSCHVAGLGRAAAREIPADGRLRMDVAALEAALREDRAAGRRPFLVVGTAGTTAAGAIDPLPALADLCGRDGLWFHVDAAWGGSWLLADRFRPHFAGVERADSVTWDAHKALQVPMGAGMFFTRRREALAAAFRTDSGYMPVRRDGRTDPFDESLLWSRRAIGLPFAAALASLGREGYARLLESMAARGDALRERLGAAGFVVLNHTPLPVVCCTHPRIEDGTRTPGDVARTLHRRGRAWVSPVTLSGGRRAVRACITSYRTDDADLGVLVDELRGAVGA
jgi:glutamate/tyrosine decarboxylase-like PLP-dependent enzyme